MRPFYPEEHPPEKCQGLLSYLVVPRPIAMITTQAEDGTVNVAPMSYYLPITGKPMLVGVTMGTRRERDLSPKDTYENAIRSGDFVINVTTDRIRDRIEDVAKEFPREVSELEAMGWTATPSQRVSSPSLAESPAHLECMIHQVTDFGEAAVPFSGVHLVIAEVVCVVLDDALADDDFHVDPLRLRAVGRLGSPHYLRTVPEGVFSLERVPWSPP